MGDTKTYNIKAIDSAQFYGDFNNAEIAIQNTQITSVIHQSSDYGELLSRIEEKRELIELLQSTGKTDRALKVDAELEELEHQLEQFKENVLRLYETFTKIEIDTERLAKAKTHFDQGEFREADAILDAEDMAQDLDQLIERDQQLDQEKAEVAKNRTQLANEYAIKARLWATFYDRPNWFEQVCEYFEEALRAANTPEIRFRYGIFLQKHNCFNKARPLYEESLQVYRELASENPRTYLPHVAGMLNNLAILQSEQNKYEAAQGNYKEALQIRCELAKENPNIYLPYVAGTLNNLANCQQFQNEYEAAKGNYEKALQVYSGLAQENPRTYSPKVAGTLNNLAILQSGQNEYEAAKGNYEKALQVYSGLAQENPRTYSPKVAGTLNNLAILQSGQNEYEAAKGNYEEALQVYSGLAQENLCTYLPKVAMTLNNLAILQSGQNEYEAAQANYEEALQLRRDLAEKNPRTYLPYVATTLINLSIFYLQSKPDSQKSVALALEALNCLQDFQQIPSLNNYAQIAYQVLEANDVDKTGKPLSTKE
ncbi:tetratricopeptide repeat protein [Leptothoe sp. EHU-05/26/07-4]